ncbi:hypothetical protein MPSEU_000766800 [Mayamaea pseudoterrestris]|nr:hypothetical protein MPSEU_000766800 [Mayamaea pseudoterrestris]
MRSPSHPVSRAVQRKRRHQHKSASFPPSKGRRRSCARRASHPQPPQPQRKQSNRRSTSRWEGAAVQKDHQLTPVMRGRRAIGCVERQCVSDKHNMSLDDVMEGLYIQPDSLQEQDLVMKLPSRQDSSPDLAAAAALCCYTSPERRTKQDYLLSQQGRRLSLCHLSPPQPLTSSSDHGPSRDVRPRMPVKTNSSTSMNNSSSTSKRWMILNNIDRAMIGTQ